MRLSNKKRVRGRGVKRKKFFPHFYSNSTSRQRRNLTRFASMPLPMLVSLPSFSTWITHSFTRKLDGFLIKLCNTPMPQPRPGLLFAASLSFSITSMCHLFLFILSLPSSLSLCLSLSVSVSVSVSVLTFAATNETICLSIDRKCVQGR